MDSANEPELKIRCLYCERLQIPPKREIDNWTCTYCHSGLISFQMLRNLAPHELLEEILALPAKKSEKRPCPMCSHPLSAVEVVHGEQTVAIEVCRDCKILWFEAGRLVSLIRLYPTEPLAVPQAPRRGLRAVRKPQEYAPPKRFVVPWVTLAVFMAVAGVSHVAAWDTSMLVRFSFYPVAPFRLLGLTLFTGPLVNPPDTLWRILFFVVAGMYCENKIKTGEFVAMCATAVLLNQFFVILIAKKGGLPYNGAHPLILATLGFATVGFLQRKRLAPEERWKSQADQAGWAGLATACIFGVSEILSMMNSTLNAAVSGDGTMSSPLIRLIQAGPQPLWATYCLSFFIGVAWASWQKDPAPARGA